MKLRNLKVNEPRMESPLVSVVIPVYNRAEKVKAAIDSVLGQDYDHIEIIVVDDGSSDGTPCVLDAYGGRIVTAGQENRGVSAARNTGIRMARGEYIAFLDSDDIWLPEKISRQIQYMQERPGLLICQTEEIWIRNGVRVNPRNIHKKIGGMIFEPSLALCLISPSSVMMRRSLLDVVGLFDEKLPACEDYDLWLRVSCRHEIGLLPEYLVVKHGGHDDQLSKTPLLDKYRICAIRKIVGSGLLSERQERAAKEMLRKKCGIYAGGCEKRGRLDEARHYRMIADSV